MRTFIIALGLFSLVLLASCEGGGSSNSATHSPLSSTEAISLAKEAGDKLASPPRIFADDKRPGNVQAWPDKPGSTSDKYNGCPGVCPLPMTTTTTVNSSSSWSGQDVIFLTQWQASDGQEKQHSWQFHVSDAAHVDLIREDGDELPHVPGDVNPLSVLRQQRWSAFT